MNVVDPAVLSVSPCLARDHGTHFWRGLLARGCADGTFLVLYTSPVIVADTTDPESCCGSRTATTTRIGRSSTSWWWLSIARWLWSTACTFTVRRPAASCASSSGTAISLRCYATATNALCEHTSAAATFARTTSTAARIRPACAAATATRRVPSSGSSSSGTRCQLATASTSSAQHGPGRAKSES